MGKKKLSIEQVKQIKLELENDYYGLHKVLSKKFNVSSCAISDIKYKRKWKKI